jgi:hypothetical protein
LIDSLQRYLARIYILKHTVHVLYHKLQFLVELDLEYPVELILSSDAYLTTSSSNVAVGLISVSVEDIREYNEARSPLRGPLTFLEGRTRAAC